MSDFVTQGDSQHYPLYGSLCNSQLFCSFLGYCHGFQVMDRNRKDAAVQALLLVFEDKYYISEPPMESALHFNT